MVLIDGARYGFLEPLLRGHRIGVAASAKNEVLYWKDDKGTRHQIDLGRFVENELLEVVSASATELADVVAVVPTSALGDGELESLAIVLAHGDRFCTADRRAFTAMRELGVGDRWVSLQTLLSALESPIAVPEEKFSDDAPRSHR